jgi:hypothetical protein
MIREPIKADLLFLDVGLRSELLFHDSPPSCAASRDGSSASMVRFGAARKSSRRRDPQNAS